MSFEKLVEIKLREAFEKGEFDNLSSKGKKIDLSSYFDTPEEMRLAFSVLKSAGLLPEEAEVLKEIQNLKDLLDSTHEKEKRYQLLKQLDDNILKFNILMDRYKRKHKGKK